MYKGALLIIPFIFLFTAFCAAQTIYGVTGLIKTPDAYIVDTGKCVMGIERFKDFQLDPKVLYDEWAVNFNVGFHSRFELGVRLGIFPGYVGDTKIYTASFDRMFNGKFVLIRENNVLPQIAVGEQDAIGTRFHNSTYATMSKNIEIIKTFNLILNAGYGTKLNDVIFDTAKNHDFIGLFEGAELGFKKRIYLIAEYDTRDVNGGVKMAVKDWFNVYFSLLKMENPSGGISLKFSL